MSSRNRGQKTLSAEDEIDADVVNTLSFSCDHNFGTANQYLRKDANNTLNWLDLEIPNDTITGSMLKDDIAITTTGNISANNLSATDTTTTNKIAQVTAINQGLGGSIDIGSNLLLETDKGMLLTGNSANIVCLGQSVISTGGKVSTPTLDNPTSGNPIAVSGDLNLATGKNLTLSSTGEVRTNSLDTSAGDGTTISCKGQLALDTDKALSLAGTGGITLSGTGNIVVGAGELRITNMNNSAGNGGDITCNGNFELATGKNLRTQGTGEVRTDIIDTSAGDGTTISCKGQLALDTDKSLSLAGTGGITLAGTGNIVVGAGELRITNMNNSAGNGGDISCKGNLVGASGKRVEADELKTYSISNKTSGNVIAVVDHIGMGFAKNISCSTTGTISTDAGDISTASGNITIGAGTSGKVQADEIVCDKISNRNSASTLQIEDNLQLANGKTFTTSGTTGTGLFGGNLGTAGNLSASGYLTLGGLSTTDPGLTNQVWVDSNGILNLSGTGGGGGSIAVSKIDHYLGYHYLQFSVSDGFTCPSGRPALHPNEINDVNIAPEIDGYLGFSEGETIIFTGKIPHGWMGDEIKFGLFNDQSGSGTGPFVLSTNTQNCRVNTKEKFNPIAPLHIEVFDCNVQHSIAAGQELVNTINEFVVIEVTDIDSGHNKAYTGGGWIRIKKIGT